MSQFNLPPPWSTGYALPENVADEGLERHAFTTQWAQRGSFDNPRVGDAGYAVPGYIVDEQYGRGAFITKWAARGSYAGPKVKHWLDTPPSKLVAQRNLRGGGRAVTFSTSTLGDVSLPSPGVLAVAAGVAYYFLIYKKGR